MLIPPKQAQILSYKIPRLENNPLMLQVPCGAFKPNEMMSVGQVYGKLEAFLSAVSQQQAKQAPTTTEAGPQKEHNMADLKHVGRLTTNNRKLVVAYRVPMNPENCLVIHTESLDAADHDTLINMVESNAGQTANELSEVMARTQLSDGSNMLGRFHTTGKLVKVATDIVELTPTEQLLLT